MDGIDTRFADVAIRKGFLSFRQIQEALEEARRSRNPLAQVLLKRRWITREQHDQIWAGLQEEPRGTGDDTTLFCEAMIRRGLLTTAQIHNALRLRQKLTKSGRPLKSLDEILIELGYATAHQIQSVRGGSSVAQFILSDSTHTKLGTLAVRKGFISRTQLQECLRIQEEEKSRTGKCRKLGEILLDRGYIDPYQLHQILTLPPSEPRPLSIPGYELIRPISRGGMGEIFKARQLSVDRLVAIKILPRDFSDAEAMDQLAREAQLLGRLDHPNIVKVIDAGRVQGRYFYVMEYVDGTTVQTLLSERGRLPERECLKIGIYTALALEHLAQNHLVHRDIKPANLIVTKDGSVKLCDLGIAEILERRSRTVDPGGHEPFAVGTPPYMSPESCMGLKVDIRSDLYSLGATLYHCATGRQPFEGDSARAVMAMHVHQQPVPPREVNPLISQRFNNLILWLMRKAPEDRPRSPAEVRNFLEQSLHEQDRISAYPRIRTRRAMAPGSRKPDRTVPGKAATVLLTLTLVVWTLLTVFLLQRLGILDLSIPVPEP